MSYKKRPGASRIIGPSEKYPRSCTVCDTGVVVGKLRKTEIARE
jgi:hypothetical protein